MRYLAVLPLFILSLCDSGTEWSSPPYQVYWVDIRSELELGYWNGENWHGRVGPRVIAVARNDLYVTAARQNDERVEYYYIEISKDNFVLNADQITKGPFDKQEFEHLATELGLPLPEPF